MKYAKAIFAAVGMIATAGSTVLADDVLDFNEMGTLLTTILVAGAGVWAVWGVKNKQDVND